MDDMNARDVARLSRWLSDDTVFWVPPREPVRGSRRIRALLRAIFSMYESLRWDVRHVYEVGPSRAVYFHETTGTRAKDGRAYANQVVTLVDFDAEGRIAYLSDYFKCTAGFSAPKDPLAICAEPAAHGSTARPAPVDGRGSTRA
jgi:ketosteroid isomerase-like protein